MSRCQKDEIRKALENRWELASDQVLSRFWLIQPAFESTIPSRPEHCHCGLS
jgi:hypothetical protein